MRSFGNMTEHRDPRVYMAAERTLLAWIRTGLALMGFGFVVARFGLFLREVASLSANAEVRSSGFSMAAGTAIVITGVLVNIFAAWQHVKAIRQLNAGVDTTGKPSAAAIALAVFLALAGLAMVVYLLAFR